MLFTTQYTAHNPKRKERNNGKTLVDEVQTKTMGDRVIQQLMSGALVEADRVGYDFTADDALPDVIATRDYKSLDITEKVALFDDVRGRIADYKQQVRDKAQAELKRLQEASETKVTSVADEAGLEAKK